MRKTWWALIFLSVLTFSAIAQTGDADWFWNKPIASVRWEGLKKADRKELDTIVSGYISKPFTEELWLELQAKLYELDWFESIEPQAVPADEAKSKLVLRFVVKEKPAIASIKVEGNSGIRAADILAALSVKTGDIYAPEKANLDDLAVVKLYLDKGYPDISVTHEALSGSDPSQLSLVFRVIEGNQVAIRKIAFAGNEFVSERTLKGQMTLKEAGLFQSGAFQEAKLDESRKAIVDYYQSKGYVDASVVDVFREYEQDPDTGKKSLTLTLSISEGRLWKYAGMDFEGNLVFDTAKLAALVTLKEGSALNYKKLQQDKAKIDDLYYESGYIFNQIALSETRDEATSSIRYTVKIVEQDRAHIENIKFQGNEKTKEFVIAREVPLEEGDIFSKSKIVEGLRNLYNLQYFSSVEPQILQGSAENLMDLVIDVKEMSTADIQFGVTLSGLGQADTFPVSAFVKWNDRNLGGTGQNLAVNATVSPSEQSLETSFSEGWLFGKRISRSLNLTLQHSSEVTGQDIIAPVFTDQDIPDPFDSLEGGSSVWSGSLSSIPKEYLMPYENWNVSLGFNAGYTVKSRVGDLGAGGGISSGLGMIDFNQDLYRPYEAEFRETDETWLMTNRLFARAYVNNLDFWYNPTGGYYASQRLTMTGILPSERQHYIKSETRLEAYATLFTLPITEAWKLKGVLMAHTGFQALFAEPWAEFKVTKDWISLDGTFNARGWNELYGSKGKIVWENSLEFRLPVVDQMLWMDLFVDAGMMQTASGLMDMTLSTPAADPARPDFGSLSWDNVAFSTGIGFRFSVPQFPFRFYFAKRFTFDGSAFSWKTQGADFDFVLSITQPLY